MINDQYKKKHERGRLSRDGVFQLFDFETSLLFKNVLLDVLDKIILHVPVKKSLNLYVNVF